MFSIFKNYFIPLETTKSAFAEENAGAPASVDWQGKKCIRIEGYKNYIGSAFYLFGKAIKVQTQDNQVIYYNKDSLSKVISPNVESLPSSKKLADFHLVISQSEVNDLIQRTNNQIKANFVQITDEQINQTNQYALEIESFTIFNENLSQLRDALNASSRNRISRYKMRVQDSIQEWKSNSKENPELKKKLEALELAMQKTPVDIKGLEWAIECINSQIRLSQENYESSIDVINKAVTGLVDYPKAIESLDLESLSKLRKIEERLPGMDSTIVALYQSKEFALRLMSLQKKLTTPPLPKTSNQIFTQLKKSNDLLELSEHGRENVKDQAKISKKSKKIFESYLECSKKIVGSMQAMAKSLSDEEIAAALSSDFDVEGLYKKAGNTLQAELKARKKASSSFSDSFIMI